MMNQVVGLFEGPNQVPAIVLAAVAFVLGMVAMCLVCKLFCPCGKKDKKCAAGKRPTGAPARAAGESEVKRPARPDDGSVEIYVGNLSYDLTEDVLNKEFAAYGTVSSVRIITNKYTGKSKGFGFVHMPNRAEAEAAVKALNEKEILGRKLTCNEAKN